MILFHFAHSANVAGILERGLIPNVPDPPHMTIGRPVVWLTTADTMKPCEGDLVWLEARRGTTFTDVEVAEFGRAICSGDTRLTVRLEPNSKRLVHYSTWLRKNPTVFLDENGHGRSDDDGNLWGTDALLETFSPSALANWWLYFGTIPPARITLPVSGRLAA